MYKNVLLPILNHMPIHPEVGLQKQVRNWTPPSGFEG
jgi:hypothetical protein